MSTNSITQKLFIRKYVMYVNNCNSVKLGFIPDVCSLLKKYKLQYIMNDFMNDPCIIPTKIIWKRTVKNAIIYKEDVLWRERLHSENDYK